MGLVKINGLSNFGCGKIQARTITQSDLTSECWGVQVWGLEHCKDCDYRNHKDCGGREIRKTGVNEHGFKVPI